MKKFIFSAIMLFSALAANAIPARSGQWRTISLVDGGTVRVQLVGDEFMHSLQAEDGTCYAIDETTGLYKPLSDDNLSQMQRHALALRKAIGKTPRHAAARQEKDKSLFQGQKKALVILAEFTNKKFRDENNLDFYKDIINGINYSNPDDNFIGSVRDYFKQQSNGAFDLDFDVVGPCPLSYTVGYYGKNDSYGNDMHPGTMVAEACQWAHDQGIDFSQYDWDGDGYVEEVFVVYAGLGEADGGSDNTIWPHMFTLTDSDHGEPLLLDGVLVDTYACCAELNSKKQNAGIGSFCHEFSHCMGFPDFYNTTYKDLTWFCMGNFDLMSSGSYNCNGRIPANYSAYEKSVCGWITLHDMTDIDKAVSVDNLKSNNDNGDAYIIRNKANSDEYYLVEYRDQKGWDVGLPDKGVMITHVDYDKYVWDANIPNTRYNYRGQGNALLYNDHQRMEIFHADNVSNPLYTSGKLYPYDGNDSLTHTSAPAATLFNDNEDGTKYMHVDIRDIAVANDGSSASMTFAPAQSVPDKPSDEKVIFYETFDQCNGKGGNDGEWNGNIANATFMPDSAGWTSDNKALYGADRCAKLGTSSSAGTITSPEIEVNGTVNLSFQAGAWNGRNDGTLLTVSVLPEGTAEESDFEIAKGEWRDIHATFTANGKIRINFSTNAGRFFLDDVKLTTATETGICINRVHDSNAAITGYFRIDGTRIATPQKGINIVRYSDGTSRKIIVK